MAKSSEYSIRQTAIILARNEGENDWYALTDAERAEYDRRSRLIEEAYS
jgi:hypothetical protein